MQKTSVAVWFNLEGPPRYFEIEHSEGKVGWQVTQHNGVDLLMIRTREGSHVRHAIPLSNVLYWTIAGHSRGSDDDWGENNRYCITCNAYVDSSNYNRHSNPSHDVRRTCCGTPTRYEHDEATCSAHNSNSSQQGHPSNDERYTILNRSTGKRINS